MHEIRAKVLTLIITAIHDQGRPIHSCRSPPMGYPTHNLEGEKRPHAVENIPKRYPQEIGFHPSSTNFPLGSRLTVNWTVSKYPLNRFLPRFLFTNLRRSNESGCMRDAHCLCPFTLDK